MELPLNSLNSTILGIIQEMALSLVEFICFWVALRMDGNKEGFSSFCAQDTLGKNSADCEDA